MKTGRVILMLLLFFMISITTIQAETYLFVSDKFPILSEETDDGNFQGIGVDLARIIGEKLGHTIIIQFYPWARAQNMVRTGEADVLIAPYKTPEREQWFNFTETPFFVDKTFFYVRPNSKIVWNGDLASLRGEKIGMPLGRSVGSAFEQAKDSLSIDYAPTLDMCIKKLMAERIDLLPTQEREALAAFKRLNLRNEKKPIALLPELATNYNYFAFSKQEKLSNFKKEFERMLKQMNESGEITQLLKEKYDFSMQQ